MLMDWYLPIGAKMPKVDALEFIGHFFEENLMEAMATFAIAWDVNDTEKRLELIDTLVWHFTLCNTAIGNLYRYSSRKDQTVRVISQLQYANYLEQINDLKSQIGGWRRKTASKT